MAHHKEIGSLTVPTLRLITDLNSTLNQHCSLCHFFHGANDAHCQHDHHRRRSTAPRTSPSQNSDDSFYSAQTSASADSTSSTTTIKAKIKPSSRRPDSPTLRHKSSPTKLSLRDLRQQQSQSAAMRRKSSDERLREIYEAQILWYLGGPHVTLDRIEE